MRGSSEPAFAVAVMDAKRGSIDGAHTLRLPCRTQPPAQVRQQAAQKRLSLRCGRAATRPTARPGSPALLVSDLVGKGKKQRHHRLRARQPLLRAHVPRADMTPSRFSAPNSGSAAEPRADRAARHRCAAPPARAGQPAPAGDARCPRAQTKCASSQAAKLLSGHTVSLRSA